jgi:ferrous iron transport protein A
MFKKLSELKQGSVAIVKAFENDELILKLMEMGFMPGENVTVEQIAPLKDPISVSVAGYLLSLRLDEAESIIVEEIIN